MTKNEFYTIIMNAESLSEEVRAKAQELKEKEAKLSAKEIEKREANSSMLKRIVDEVLTAEPMTAAAIAAVMEITPQKASSLMAHAPEGMFETKEIKNEKGNKVKGYFVVR